jgi:hypothetical protein
MTCFWQLNQASDPRDTATEAIRVVRYSRPAVST